MTATPPIALTLLGAIDSPRHRHAALIAIPDKKRRHRLTPTKRSGDLDRLKVRANYNMPVRIGFGATASCHRAPTAHLFRVGLELQ